MESSSSKQNGKSRRHQPWNQCLRSLWEHPQTNGWQWTITIESMGGWQTIWVNVATCWSKDALARNYVTDQQVEGLEEGIILLSHTTQKNDAKWISKKKSTAYSKSVSYPISAASPSFACTDTSGSDAACLSAAELKHWQRSNEHWRGEKKIHIVKIMVWKTAEQWPGKWEIDKTRRWGILASALIVLTPIALARRHLFFFVGGDLSTSHYFELLTLNPRHKPCNYSSEILFYDFYLAFREWPFSCLTAQRRAPKNVISSADIYGCIRKPRSLAPVICIFKKMVGEGGAKPCWICLFIAAKKSRELADVVKGTLHTSSSIRIKGRKVWQI